MGHDYTSEAHNLCNASGVFGVLASFQGMQSKYFTLLRVAWERG